MRIPILTLLLIVFVPHSGFAQDFKFAEEYPFKVGDNQGKVEISLHQTVLRRGESYGVNFRFTNTTGSYPIYNWQFMHLIPLPGQLAVYDANYDYIGDLIAVWFGSRIQTGLRDWTYLYGGSSVGASLRFRVGNVPLGKYMAEGSLPPGRYYLQLIMYKAFVSERPYLTEDVMEDFRRKFDRGELCRSNIIKVEIIDK